jgi:hypothetical protein
MGVKDHMPDAKQRKATLTRNSKYRENGYKYISDTGSRLLIYSSPKKLTNIMSVLATRGTRPNPRTVKPASMGHAKRYAKRYAFKYKTNFKVGGAPYVNEAHHLLPESAFTIPPFTSDQIKLLWMVDYDVNNKKNIIFLPKRTRDCDFHLLPNHSGDHPRYTSLVKADMSKLRTQLNDIIKSDPDHKNWSPPNDIKKKLLDLQKDYWTYLTNCGPMSVNEFKKSESSPIARRRRNALTKTKK